MVKYATSAKTMIFSILEVWPDIERKLTKKISDTVVPLVSYFI